MTADNVTVTTSTVTYVVTFDPPALQLELLDGSGEPTNDLTGVEQASVIVTLSNSAGPIAGEIVQLSVGDGAVLGQSSGLTDANGQVTTTMTAVNISAAGTLQAEVTLDQTGVTSSLNYRINDDADDIGSVNLQLSVDEVTIAPLTESTASILVTQNDADSTPVEGAVVNFSADGVELIPASGSVFTNELGIAEVEIRAGASPGGTQLNVQVVVGEQTFDAKPINLIVAEALLEITLSDNVVEANEQITVQARLVEATDQRLPIADTVVLFETTIGAFSTDSGLTDADGLVTLNMIGGSDAGEGTVTASASVNGNAVTGTSSFQNIGEQSTEENGLVLAASGMVDAGGNPDSVLAGNEVATITATVTEDGAPAGGVAVLFSASQGQLSASSATTSVVDGTATVELTGVGTAGVAVVDATANLSNDLQVSGSVTVQTSNERPVLRLVDASDAIIENIELSAAESATVTAIVEDWDGSRVDDLGVTMTATSVDQDITSGKTVNGEIDVVLTGKQESGVGTLRATATFGIFSDLSDEITVTSLGVNAATDNLIIQETALNTALGANAALDGNEKVDVTVVVTEGSAVKEGITVLFSSTGAGAGTLEVTSDVTDATGTASVELIGIGVAGTTDVKATAVLDNGISVEHTVTLQTSAITPTVDLIVRDSAGVIVDTFGANQELTLEATILDFDGTDLGVGDQGLSVTFTIEDALLGSLDPNDTAVVSAQDIAETNFCPVNGVQASSDCAVVTLTSSANGVVGSLKASVVVNNVSVDDTEVVTNTGINSGSPDQNSFTISRANFAISDTVALEGDLYNNQIQTIRVDLADFFNNPVPDGTLVEFTTELGDITPNCSTSGGQCDVQFTTADPRVPDNSEVSFRNVDDDGCPSQNVMDEIVTVTTSGADVVGLTDYRVSDVMRVIETGGDGDVDFGVNVTVLSEGADYTVTSNGIECVTCIAGVQLAITYRRLWLDEEDDGLSDHVILNPGEATEPFVGVSGIPCLASARSTVVQISGSIDPTASVGVTGVGTAFMSDLAVGDRIKASGEVRSVASIASDTSLTVDTAFSDNLNDISPGRIAAPAYQGGLGQPYGGRATVLAYAIGEESFIDVNGNEEYDFGETFFDLTEAFLDKNEDGVLGDFQGDSAVPGVIGPYNDAGLGAAPPGNARDKSSPFCYGPRTIVGLSDGVNDSTEQEVYCYEDGGEEEIFIDFNADGLMDVGNGIYNGSRCLTPLQDADGGGVADDVVCTTDLLHVSRSIQLLMSGSFADTIFRSGTGGTNGGGEIVDTITVLGNQLVGEQITDGGFSAETSWTISGAAVTIAAGYAAITSVGVEDLLSQAGIFASGRTHEVSLDITVYTSGSVDVLADGDVIATCASAGTCTASGISAVGTFAIVSTGGFVGQVDNVSVIATTTGQTTTFAGPSVASNDNTTMLTAFEVGDTLDNATVFAGVSERNAVALTTTNTYVRLYVTDRFNGQMPDAPDAGTTVTVDSNNAAGCLLTTVRGISVTPPAPAGTHSHTVTIGTEVGQVVGISVAPGVGGGYVTATVTTPIGNTVSRSFYCDL